MDEFEGYVDRITFRNEENGYTVLYLVNPKAEDTEDEEECCVGCFSYVAEGSYLLVKGKEPYIKIMDHSFWLKAMKKSSRMIPLH